MNELGALRRILITRFLQITVITAIVETVIFWAVERTVIVGLLNFFFGTSDVAEIGFARLAAALVTMLAGAVLGVIGSFLPNQGFETVNVAVRMFNRLTLRAFGLPVTSGQINDLPVIYRLVLWWVLFSVMVVLLIPVAVAAIVYAKTVMGEFERIEEAERIKQRTYEQKRSLMISDIAHDLRTPMTTVMGYARALEDGLIPEDGITDIYKSLQAKTARMNDLIDLLFEYGKLDSEGYALTLKEINICELVRECAALYYGDIENAGMELDIDVPEFGIIVRADELELSRVVNNLLTNAIRHNATGTSIGVKMTYDGTDALIMICDNGSPIDEKYAEHIFEPFVTGDASRHSGGSGLGLSIASKIADMHGFKLQLIQRRDMTLFQASAGYAKMFTITIPGSCIVSTARHRSDEV